MSTEKKTKGLELTLGEVAQLNRELIEMLKEPKISFVLKYDLSKLLTKTGEISRNMEKQKLGIFKEFGVCIDEKKQEYSLEGSDKIKEGLDALEELFAKKEAFTESFELAKFEAVESSYPYIQLMKFLN